MKFGHIEIFVSDPLQTAKQFYQDILEFEITSAREDQLVWLKKGDLEILLRQGQPPRAADRYEKASLGLVLYTNDLNQSIETLEGRGLEFKGTVDSEKCYTFTDPDGNWFQLVNPHDH